MKSTLLAELRARCVADLQDMCAAIDRRDFASVDRLAHRMVGAAGALEMHGVCREAREVCRVARAGETVAVMAALRRLEAAVAEWSGA